MTWWLALHLLSPFMPRGLVSRQILRLLMGFGPHARTLQAREVLRGLSEAVTLPEHTHNSSNQTNAPELVLCPECQVAVSWNSQCHNECRHLCCQFHHSYQDEVADSTLQAVIFHTGTSGPNSSAYTLAEFAGIGHRGLQERPELNPILKRICLGIWVLENALGK